MCNYGATASYLETIQMKLLKNAAIIACLITSISVQAQKKNKEKTKFTPPVIVKDKNEVVQSEEKTKEYKSKQWHQGDEVISEENKNGRKNMPGMKKKSHEFRNVPPSPPPPPSPRIKEKS